MEVSLPRPKGSSISDALEEYLHRQGIKSRVAEASIVAEWNQLVGEKLAAVCQPVMIDQSGTLWIRVKSAAWMQELQLMSPTLIHELAKRRRRVKRIRWVAGKVNPTEWSEDEQRGARSRSSRSTT